MRITTPLDRVIAEPLVGWHDTVGAVCDVAGLVLLTIGAIACLTSAIGIVRLDEVYARMHAATKPQVFGVLMVLLGVGLRLRDPSVVGLLVVTGLSQLLTIPAAAQLLARAHLRSGPVTTPSDGKRPRPIVTLTDSR